MMMMMMPAILMVMSSAAPHCSVLDRPVATRKADLPIEVRKALPEPMADPGEPFHVSDAVLPGQERWPWSRLICGYVVPDGYVIERERGGRGYSVGKIFLHRTSKGFFE